MNIVHFQLDMRGLGGVMAASSADFLALCLSLNESLEYQQVGEFPDKIAILFFEEHILGISEVSKEDISDAIVTFYRNLFGNNTVEESSDAQRNIDAIVYQL